MAPPPVPPVGQAPGSRGPPTRLGQPCTAVCTAAQRQQKVGPDLSSGPAFRGSWAWDSVIAYRGGGGVGIGPESPPSPRPDVTASGLDVRFHAHADLLACGVLAPFINHQLSPDGRCTLPSRFNIRLHVHPMGPGGLGDGGMSCPYPALIFVFTFIVCPPAMLASAGVYVDTPRHGPLTPGLHVGLHLHGISLLSSARLVVLVTSLRVPRGLPRRPVLPPSSQP
jgi:hypothetical protein